MFRAFLYLLLATLLLTPTAAQAQTPPPVSGKTVTFTVINGDFLTTLVRLERQYHIQCVLQDGVDAHSKINISLSGIPLLQALNFLASSANAEVTQSPDGVYVFIPKPVVPLTAPDYFIPPTHFIGGFGTGSFGTEGFGGSSQSYPSVIFPHTLPAPLSDTLSGRDLRPALPGGVPHIFALGQSF